MRHNHLILLLILTGISNPTNANVVYEINGNLTGLFSPVTEDPAADLLGVPRAIAPLQSLHTIPFSLNIEFDQNNPATILADNSAGQQYLYTNAVKSVVLNLNGAEFKTIRPTDQADIESTFLVTNSQSSTDGFELKIFGNDNVSASSDFFNTHNVPFNQTINGKTYETADIVLGQLAFSGIGPNLINSAAIPTSSDSFNTTFSNLTIFLRTFSEGDPLSSTGLSLGSNPLTVSVKTVPIPAALPLFISALGIFSFSSLFKRRIMAL